MDNETLKGVINKHIRWLHSGQTDGERGILCGEDLSKMNLNEEVLIRIDFSGADLRGASLFKTNLKSANLRGAHLREAELRGVNLINADLVGANCIQAVFREGFLRQADFSGAHLMDADFRDANLMESMMRGAKLQGSDIRGATLVDIDLRDAVLDKAKMRGVNLRNANLIGASLRNVDLSKADLREADFTDADLTDADLSDSLLTGMRLDRTKLDGADLSRIIVDNETHDQIPAHIREKFEKTWKYTGTKDRSGGQVITRSIALPGEYRSAGIALMHYFASVLQNRHPEQKISFRIDIKGENTSLIITPIEGDAAVIDGAMREYYEVVTGARRIEDYTEDPFLIMEMKRELDFSRLYIESQKEIVKYKFGVDTKKVFEIKLETLFSLIRGVFSPTT